MRGARKILSLYKNELKKRLERNPEYELIVTGHSLGAGTAELITMILLGENDNEKYIPRNTQGLKLKILTILSNFSLFFQLSFLRGLGPSTRLHSHGHNLNASED